MGLYGGGSKSPGRPPRPASQCADLVPVGVSISDVARYGWGREEDGTMATKINY